MTAAPNDDPPVEWRRSKRGILRRPSAVVLLMGVGAFGMFDPPAEDAGVPPGGTTFTRRYHPPVVTGGGVQLGPATRISKRP